MLQVTEGLELGMGAIRKPGLSLTLTEGIWPLLSAFLGAPAFCSLPRPDFSASLSSL